MTNKYLTKIAETTKAESNRAVASGVVGAITGGAAANHYLKRAEGSLKSKGKLTSLAAKGTMAVSRTVLPVVAAVAAGRAVHTLTTPKRDETS